MGVLEYCIKAKIHSINKVDSSYRLEIEAKPCYGHLFKSLDEPYIVIENCDISKFLFKAEGCAVFKDTTNPFMSKATFAGQTAIPIPLKEGRFCFCIDLKKDSPTAINFFSTICNDPPPNFISISVYIDSTSYTMLTYKSDGQINCWEQLEATMYPTLKTLSTPSNQNFTFSAEVSISGANGITIPAQLKSITIA